MAAERVILVAIIATTLINVASAISGSAIYADFPYPTECGYSGPEETGTMVAAISSFIWKSEDCDKLYRVRCIGRSGPNQPCKNNDEITVKIIEICPVCLPDRIELSLQAFSMISELDNGRIDVEYYPV